VADQPTCGQGLAEHSTLQLKLAELTAAVAHNLELHMEALDLDDEHARQEQVVYMQLTQRHREIAAQLRAAGGEMAAQRDLPMGRHDQPALSSPSVVAAFEGLVNAEQELLTLLQDRAEQHRTLLAAMRSAVSR
jgi:hypothetical protein